MSGLPTIQCAYCGAEMDVLEGLERIGARGFALQVSRLPGEPALRAAVLRYIGLFGKRRLSPSRAERLLTEINDMMSAGKVRHAGRVWAAPLPYWSQALDSLFDKADLRLPLKGHGLLLAILAGMAQQAEAAQERERHLRSSGATPIGLSNAHVPFATSEPVPTRNAETVAHALAEMKSMLKKGGQ